MRIYRRSASSAGIALGALALGTAAPAENSAPPAATALPPEPANARARIQAEGSTAMERLRDAVGRQKSPPIRGPESPPIPTPDEPIRRRAFEAMRKHATDPAMEARARAAKQASEAQMAAAREAMAKRLKQALGLEAPDMDTVVKAAAPSARHGWVPLLFVSSSMPITTLRSYAAQVERVGGVLAFRGMPGGLHKVGPMAKLTAEILRLDPGCEGPACTMRNAQLIVDPIVFRQHGIAQVPALAMIPGDPTQPYCERDEQSPTSANVIYGDSALTGLLEEYARLGRKEEVRDAQARLGNR
jgi:type-F conjugative transfer system pilin assembly protein TrbC